MKKRILSLILALSMVLSVLPLGAFAAGSTQDLVIGSDGYPVGSEGGSKDCNGGGNGNDWEYYSKSRILCLNGGTFDLSTTEPVKCEIHSFATITDGTFNGAVYNLTETISGGIFNGTVTNDPTGKISGGTFAGSVENQGTIKNGSFEGKVTNNGTITGTGTFNGEVTNNAQGTISGGTFQSTGSVENSGTIEKGTFEGQVTNDSNGKISGGTFQSTGSVTNEGTITGNGTFNGTVTNSRYIENGTFNGTVTNSRYIKNGTFNGTVTNNDAIFGGIFAGSVNNSEGCNIYGGVFNGKTGLDGVTVLISITWDAAYPNAKITEVNGVSADWKPYVVVTSFTETREVIITADTEIFSLNGYPIDGSPYSSSYPDTTDKKTVKFTELGVLDYEVVLNGAITHGGDLVMENGYPKASIGGKYSCTGNGWEYDSSGKLILTSGTYDFSSTHPQGKTPGTPTTTPVACAVETQSGVEITGGTFNGEVRNSGTIERGTFAGGVTNSGTIKNGTFACSVTNYSNIESKGTFNGTVENYGGTISSGTFKGTVQNWYGTISGGTFHEKVLNSNGEITGGTFAAGLSANHNTVTGGVFNGKTGLTDALHVTVTNGSVDKVNGVVTTGTAWDLYAYAGTTVTITADTEIFSLNDQPIGTGNCNSSQDSNDKTTVTFTMPDDDVVLNKAITSTDLVMENGWPKDSNGGTIPCKGDGWEYIPNDPTNGDMLLLTGSNQTGGLFDFSTIGDGSAVECNVFVGKPTAITGGEFNGKVFNNSGILGGTFHGSVENMGPGRIMNGTFKNSVENNGMIENGAFHDAVKNNGTINDGTFHGKVENNSVINSGTFHGSVDNTTMGRIENGMFNDAVENNGTIEKGTFNGAVENNGTINGGVFNGAVTGSGTVSESITGSGTLNGEPITKTEPEPEPEPTTYTVTVIGGTIDGKTSVSAKENDTLTVVLDQNDIPDGMTFDLWSISSSKLSGDINVDYRAEAMTFQMPAEDVTIRAQYRSAEIIEDAAPSPLATAATIAVGGAAAGIVVWQGVSLGVDLYLANALPQGVPVPTDRRALALLLWETAGKPEVALPTLYGDIPTEEIELQKATRWAVQNGLMDAADKKDASFFDPDHYVTKMDVFGAWLRLKKLLGTT